MNYWIVAASALIGYLFGSLNLSIYLSKLLLKKDIRQFGSGNAGGTNVLRTMGWKMGLLVVLFDALKGIIAMLIAMLISNGEEVAFVVAGFFAVVGHIAPLYHRFKGGKGVATGAAVFAMIDWRAFLVILAVFIITVCVTRFVSLGSILGAISFPISLLVFQDRSPFVLLICSLLSLLVISMHHGNIKRLLHGEERKLGRK